MQFSLTTTSASLPCKRRKLISQPTLIFGLNYKLGMEIKCKREEATGTAESPAGWLWGFVHTDKSFLALCIIHQASFSQLCLGSSLVPLSASLGLSHSVPSKHSYGARRNRAMCVCSFDNCRPQDVVPNSVC